MSWAPHGSPWFLSAWHRRRLEHSWAHQLITQSLAGSTGAGRQLLCHLSLHQAARRSIPSPMSSPLASSTSPLRFSCPSSFADFAWQTQRFDWQFQVVKHASHPEISCFLPVCSLALSPSYWINLREERFSSVPWIGWDTSALARVVCHPLWSQAWWTFHFWAGARLHLRRSYVRWHLNFSAICRGWGQLRASM